MTDDKQNEFLIDMLRAMILDLLVYRTFTEKEKRDAGPLRLQEIEGFLNSVRMDAGVRTQLGPDFAAFVASALQGEERDAGLLLSSFLSEWFPRSGLN